MGVSRKMVQQLAGVDAACGLRLILDTFLS
jgi:hypothetical protein